MSLPEEADFAALTAQVTRQSALIRSLKQSDGSPLEIQRAVEQLKALRVALKESQHQELASDTSRLSGKHKKALEELLIRKMFIVPSFEIYGGIAGFFDYGPPACALKNNILQIWRRNFVKADGLMEIECTNLMPEIVLKTSGHVDRFTDLMVKCTKSGECFRADKLLEDHIDRLLAASPLMPEEEKEQHRKIVAMAESYSPSELHNVFQKYEIKSPGSGALLSEPVPFNLMFGCQIGPEGNQTGYLRPETAQGIFLNFRRLLEYNAGKIPFGCAQIGHAFRNEISPRGGLLRVREFQQAEIEYFVNPKDKRHPKFASVSNVNLPFFTKNHQLSDGRIVKMTCQDAVAQNVVANESLAYYMAKTYLFALDIGIDMYRIRFRQHLDTEMSHYATDCWDLEVLLSSGWVECVGHADRSCYDLTVHAKKSKVELVGTYKFPQPEMRRIVELKLNKGKIGRTFKFEASLIYEALELLKDDVDAAMKLEEDFCINNSAIVRSLKDGKEFALSREMVQFEIVEKLVHEEKFIPSVIEPSFGIGRLVCAVFEHSFSVRKDDEKRNVLSFLPLVAPMKASIFPISMLESFLPIINELESGLAMNGIEYKTDTSSVAIGRKYARADEVGIPFNITIDFDTLKDRTVTLRERDSCAQIRLSLDKAIVEVRRLTDGSIEWDELYGISQVFTPSGE